MENASWEVDDQSSPPSAFTCGAPSPEEREAWRVAEHGSSAYAGPDFAPTGKPGGGLSWAQFEADLAETPWRACGYGRAAIAAGFKTPAELCAALGNTDDASERVDLLKKTSPPICEDTSDAFTLTSILMSLDLLQPHRIATTLPPPADLTWEDFFNVVPFPLKEYVHAGTVTTAGFPFPVDLHNELATKYKYDAAECVKFFVDEGICPNIVVANGLLSVFLRFVLIGGGARQRAQADLTRTQQAAQADPHSTSVSSSLHSVDVGTRRFCGTLASWDAFNSAAPYGGTLWKDGVVAVQYGHTTPFALYVHLTNLEQDADRVLYVTTPKRDNIDAICDGRPAGECLIAELKKQLSALTE